MKVGYIRVSTAEQHEDRQRAALEQYGIEKWYMDKASGKNLKERPQLCACLDYVREGDTLYVMDFSRLARSTKDLLDIVDLLKDKNVKLVSLKENLDTETPTGQLMLTMMAAIAEFERQNLLERQAEGIAIAKEKGVYKGRKRISPADYKNFDRYYMMYLRGELSKTGFSKKLKISLPTMNRLLKEYGQGEQEN